MPSQRRIGVVLGYANLIVKNLVNLVYTPMLLSFVGQADYGVYQTSNSFVFSLSLLSFGFSAAYVRFYTQKRAHGEDVRGLNGVYLVFYAVVSLVALLLGLAFAASAGTIFSSSFTSDEVELAQTVMSIMAGSIAVTLFNSVFNAYILAHEKFRFQQTRQLVTTLATPFASYALLCLGAGVVGVAIAQLAVNLVLLGLNASFCLGRLKMRFDVRRFDVPLFRSIAVFSTWIFTNQICDLVNQNVPNMLLGALTSASVVAVFAVSVQIRSVFYSLSTIMSSVFAPKINQMVASSNDNKELTALMTRVGRYQAILYVWVLGGFVLLGNFFVLKWAGESFADAYWLILTMVVPLFIPLVQNVGIEIQRAKNMHKPRSVCYLITAALNVALTAALSGLIGYWAPVIGYIVHALFGCGIFMNWYYHRRVGLDMIYFWKRVLPVVGVGALVVAVCFVGTAALPVAGWIQFAAWGIAYSVFYAVLCAVLVLDKGERIAVAKRAKKIFGR